MDQKKFNERPQEQEQEQKQKQHQRQQKNRLLLQLDLEADEKFKFQFPTFATMREGFRSPSLSLFSLHSLEEQTSQHNENHQIARRQGSNLETLNAKSNTQRLESRSRRRYNPVSLVKCGSKHCISCNDGCTACCTIAQRTSAIMQSLSQCTDEQPGCSREYYKAQSTLKMPVYHKHMKHNPLPAFSSLSLRPQSDSDEVSSAVTTTVDKQDNNDNQEETEEEQSRTYNNGMREVVNFIKELKNFKALSRSKIERKTKLEKITINLALLEQENLELTKKINSLYKRVEEKCSLQEDDEMEAIPELCTDMKKCNL